MSIDGRYPKQKLLRYVLQLFSSQTDDIPTSSGVSEEVVKKTSPYCTSFCFLFISMSSTPEGSEIGLLNMFRYVTNLPSPWPKSSLHFPDNPVNVVPTSPSLRCSQVLHNNALVIFYFYTK